MSLTPARHSYNVRFEMKPLGYISIGILIGALACAAFIYSTVGHYRDPQHNWNMGYLDAQHDIVIELEKHFGSEGVFPGFAEQQIQPDPAKPTIFGLKTTSVVAAEKNGIPTLYIYP